MSISSLPQRPRIGLLIGLLVLYVILAALLFPLYRYQISPDGIAYLDLGRKYLAGDWHNAVNAYWGPLLPILLVPFLALPVGAMTAGKLCLIAIGAFALGATWLLSYRFPITPRVRAVVLAGLVPSLLAFVFTQTTPDLLMVGLLALYFYVIFEPGYSVKSAVYAGLVGGLLYFAKSYGLVFFLAHFTLFHVLLWWRSRRQTDNPRARWTQAYGAGVAACLVLSGVWIGLISQKYGHFVIGTSAKYNQALVGPTRPHHPMLEDGFMPPSNPTATSIWEDPTPIEIQTWSPLKEPGHQLKLLGENLAEVVLILLRGFYLGPVILLAYVWAAVRKANPLRTQVLLALSVYLLGYMLVLMTGRYVWIAFVLLALMGADIVCRAPVSRTVRLALITVQIACLLIPTVLLLKQSVNNGAEVFHQYSAIKDNQIEVGPKIASNTGAWHEAYYLAFWLGGHSYGAYKVNGSDDDLQAQLERYGIDSYLVFNGGPLPTFLRWYEEVDGGKVPGVKIFNLHRRVLWHSSR